MDLAGQLAAVWARRVVLVLVAAAVAAAVFVWRSEAPERYEATSTLQVRLPDTDSNDPSTQAEFYAETVSGLLTSRAVVADALEFVDRRDDPRDVAETIETATGSEPGFVTVTATGPTAREAALLADALVSAVDLRVTADQEGDLAAERALLEKALADVLRNLEGAPATDDALRAALEHEREELLSALRSNANRVPWRVAVVDGADPPDSATSPVPARDALLAFLVALILAAEALVIARAWRGSVSVRDPAGDVAEALDAPAVEVRPDAGIVALAPLLTHLGDAKQVAVVRVGLRPRARVAVLLAELLAERGGSVVLVDAAPGTPVLPHELNLPPGPGLTTLPEDDRRLAQELEALPRLGHVRVIQSGGRATSDGPSAHEQIARVVAATACDHLVLATSVRRLDDVVALLGDGSDLVVVLDVEAAGATRNDLRDTAAALRGLGARLVAATVTPARSRRGLGPRRRRKVIPADVVTGSG